MAQYAVSIIIPFFNTEPQYFDVCIESVLNQDFTNFEMIVINDGSYEKYRKYLDNLEEKDARIRVYHTENRGVSEARNLGLKNAKGETVCFIDADDYVAIWMLKDLWDAYQSKDVEAVVSRYRLVSSNEYKFVRNNEIKIVDNSKLLDTTLIGMNCNPTEHGYLSAGPVAVLFNAKIAKTIAFPKGIKYMEDVIWNYQFFSQTNKVAVLNECVYAYRQNNSSVTHSYKLEMIEDRIQSLNIIRKLTGVNKEWYALRVFANYAICCKGIMRTDEIHGLRQRIRYVREMNKNPIWKGFREKGIDRRWDRKYKIKKWMAVFGLLPFVYCFKEF